MPEAKPDTDSSKALALEKLSPREREIINMVAMGLSNQSIGEKLFISDKTVKNYVTSIRRKLGLENRIQVALYAIRCGLVDPGSGA
ncbi:MAG: response regulator transcription factor [Clostridia bacterium]|nr:response regulator transcription factor [Clostridia bacterium]